MTTEFNEQLKSRLLAFQKAHGLVDDGMVGGETWRQLVDAGSAGLAGSTGVQQQGATAHKSDADAGFPQSSQAVEAIASDHSAVSSVHGGTPFYINPDVFDFKPGPKGSNWQKTGCVEIVFGHASSPFLPMSLSA